MRRPLLEKELPKSSLEVSWIAGRGVFVLLVALLLCIAPRLQAYDLDDARGQFASGDYAGSVETLRKAMKDGAAGEERYLLLSKGLMTLGKYPEARAAITNALAEEPSSIRLRWQAREVFLSNGEVEAAGGMVEEVLQRITADPRSYRSPSDLVIFSQAALLKNADPKKILDQVLGAALKADPKFVGVYLVAGNLALDKHDYALAAKKFEQGLKEAPDDIELKFGLARAYEPSDSALMVASLESVLERNSNHIGSLLLLVDRAIDAEDYEGSGKILDQIKGVNPWHPEAWAYRAIIAHLENKQEDEKTSRATALKYWPTNPRVDYLIGLKLSQKYRFAEGAEHQRQALKFDAGYLPSKGQLAHDLLRLGEEDEGWDIAQEVHKEDGYDVEAFNVMNLRDTMSKFVTLTNQDFLIRMGAQEAKLYGDEVLDLLASARSNLCAKYGIEIKRPAIVEIFPDQKDFAVRTFGMPGNPGYLGVCFGTVVTANSPAVQHSHPVNWQAVLWHEFCHVVTLQMTKNKMPRWLSEGISVYEEIQANPSWGQHMSPRYREMILDEELTPVGKLSGAFLSPESELHLQFAYYESSLVVEFLVQRFGIEKLRAVLRDLGQGMEINAAIAKNTEAMDKLEEGFAAFAKERAMNLAPGLDFAKPDFEKKQVASRSMRGPRKRRSGNRIIGLDPTNEVVSAEATNRISHTKSETNSPARPGVALSPPIPETFQEWVKSNPTNFWAMSAQAATLTEAKQWTEAKPLLERLIALYPNSIGPDSAYPLLATTYRALGDTNSERKVLAQFAAKDDEAPEAYLRLMEIASASGNWEEVRENARRFLAVNPLVATPHRYLLEASEHSRDDRGAIKACKALLELDPPDPAGTHFQMAKLLHRVGDPAARRHVLQALEEAPRYRDALDLLLQINNSAPANSAPTAAKGEAIH